jgi:hypothetical protein
MGPGKFGALYGKTCRKESTGQFVTPSIACRFNFLQILPGRSGIPSESPNFEKLNYILTT